MQTQFGRFDPDGGDDFLRPVYFPSLASMDARTGDGRMLVSGGGSVYGDSLPRPIMAQFQTGAGHDGAKVVGSLQEVTFHDDGNISGKGWLADVDDAHLLVTLAQTKSLFHNSVDLADVEYTAEWGSDDPEDPAFWDLNVDFTRYGIAATTFVNVPAFANAHGSLSDEVTASARNRSPVPLEVRFESTAITLTVEREEVTAAAAPAAPYADFHMPEARTLTKVTVDETGRVFGHLAAWGSCHAGFENRCVLAPRPADNYASFMQPGVLTDRGMVETGPIFFLGGHPAKPLGNGDRWAAYGGVENAWADVRVVNGVAGPWISGRVRPGITPDALYAARASRVSGHWKTDTSLAAIVSVNVAGYNIPGSGLSADKDGGRIEGGKVVELVASLHVPPVPDRPSAEEVFDMLGGIDRWSSMTPIQYTSGTTTSTFTEAAGKAMSTADITPIDDVDPSETPGLNRERLALELELELELDD